MEGRGPEEEDELQMEDVEEATASTSSTAAVPATTTTPTTTTQLSGSGSAYLRRRTSRDGADAGGTMQRSTLATSSLHQRQLAQQGTASTTSGDEDRQQGVGGAGDGGAGDGDDESSRGSSSSIASADSAIWNTRRRTDMVDVLERRREAFQRGAGRSSASVGSAWSELLQQSLSDVTSLRQSLRSDPHITGRQDLNRDGEDEEEEGQGTRPSSSTLASSSLLLELGSSSMATRPRPSGEHVRFRLLRTESNETDWSSDDHDDDDDDDDAVRLSSMDLEQGSGRVRSRSMLTSSMRQLPSAMTERLPLLTRASVGSRPRNRAPLIKDKVSDSEDSDATMSDSTSSSFSFSPRTSSTAVPTSQQRMRTSLNYMNEDFTRSIDGIAASSLNTQSPRTLDEMRRRLPPIFTISTEAVEFNFDAAETYGKYQERRITRPRARTTRQSQRPPLAYTPPPSSQRIKRFPKWFQKLLILLGDAWLLLSSHHRFLWLFLPLLGFLCGLLGGLIDLIVDAGHYAHYYMADHIVTYYYGQYCLWILFTIALTCGSMAFIRINPAAQGSGVPELKSILSGVQLNNFLAPSIFIAKLGSMTCAAAGGIIVSKGGPFIHLCALVAHFLCKLPLFTLIDASKTMHNVMLSVGCGMGIAADVNVPIGGVLFSIEVTSTYFPVRNYFYSFYAAVVGSIVNRSITGSPFVLSTELPRESWVWAELLFHALVGVLGGILGAIFVWVFGSLIRGRRWLVNQADEGRGSAWKRFLFIFSHPYTWGLFVAIYTALLTFPGNYRFMSLSTWSALRDLSHVGRLDDIGEHANDWLALPFYLSLVYFVFSRFTGCVLAATMPISSGIFGPCLAMGMGLGRIVGEYLNDTFPNGLAYFSQDLATSIIPATYAITGAAAFGAGVTHTLSTAIIILEMSGQLNLVPPIMVAVSCAVATSRLFTVNYYDKISILRNLPYLPDLDASVYEVTAAEIMDMNVPHVLHHATPKEVASLLSKNPDRSVFPVVNDKDSMTLKGYVERRQLTSYLLQCFQLVVDALNEAPEDEDDEEAVSRRIGRSLAAAMTPTTVREDIRQARGESSNRTAGKPYGTFDQRKRSIGRQPSTEQVVTLTEAELLSKFKLFEGDDSSLTPEERKTLPAIPHTPLPIQIADIMPITEIHMLFITFRLTEGYVTSQGKLVGVIDRDLLKRAIDAFSNSPKNALMRFCKFYVH